MEHGRARGGIAGQDHSGDESHLVREIMRAHQAILNAFSREVGIPAARLGIIRLLAVPEADGTGVMEIARRLGVNAAAVTRQVADLEAQELMTRRPDPRDKRRITLRLTPKGQRLFRQVHGRAHEFERALRSSASDAEIATTIRVLTEVRRAINKLT